MYFRIGYLLFFLEDRLLCDFYDFINVLIGGKEFKCWKDWFLVDRDKDIVF